MSRTYRDMQRHAEVRRLIERRQARLWKAALRLFAVLFPPTPPGPTAGRASW